jgi:stage II sporulation protein D
MLPTCHEEALKAQAVASYTYAKRVTENSSDFITDSPLTHQGYADRQTRMQNWGADFERNEQKTAQAVDAVYGCFVAYNGEIALTLYHSISAGQTQSAEALWGEDYPYLQSVPSQGDRLSPDFISKSVFEPEEFAELLGISGEGDTAQWVEDIKSENGYVTSAVICGKEFTASQIRDLLELKSTAFEILCEEEKITVTCKGHGHGVGMSQYGADYMARQGSSWQEILLHYYPTATIEKP